jgi:hypothetical protein
MIHSIYKTYLPLMILLTFSFQVIFFSPEIYAQGMSKINDLPGGGSGSTSQNQDTGGNDSATLLIVGVVIIAGILVYKLVIDKDEPKAEEKKDSTSNQSLLIRDSASKKNQLTSAVRKMEQLPVNLYVGIQQAGIILQERKLIFGVSYNF